MKVPHDVLAHIYKVVAHPTCKRFCMAACHGYPLGHRRQLRLGQVCQGRLSLAKNPGVSLSCPRNHDGIAARLGNQGGSIGPALDIAIANHRHTHGRLHTGHHIPVGRACVELSGRAPVDGEGSSPRLLHHAGKIHGDVLTCRVSLAELDRYGMRHRRAHLGNNRTGQGGLLHESTAIAFAGNLAGRASHIDIDIGQGLAHLLFYPGGLTRHHLGFVAKNLHRH